MKIDFMSPIVSNGIRLMHSKSDSTEIIIANDTDEIIEELFQSLPVQIVKGESLKDGKYFFDHIDKLHCK